MNPRLKTRITQFLLILPLTQVILACKPQQDPLPTEAATQSFEIKVDNKVITMQPDQPQEGILVSCNYVQNAAFFSLGVFHKKEDFQFGIMGKIDQLQPGTYHIYECLSHVDCEDLNQDALFSPYPTGQPYDPKTIKLAYKSPDLGLEPLTLVITKVEDAVWPGVPGIVKRVKGTFKASLAYVETHPTTKMHHIVEPLKQVEGKFDLYCPVK